MKRHKIFRTALFVSVQERRELYPEMTDSDVVAALNNIVGQLRANITRQKQAADRRSWGEILARPLPTPAEAEREREARRQRLEAEARQRAAEAQRHAAEYEQRMAAIEEQRKLCEDIVRAGHRLLAQKYHPDKGGSTEQMIKLNRARGALLGR
jgi:hypothetical protein